MDFRKLFPNLKKTTEKELKDKEKSLSVGDHVSVVKNIRCKQAGKSGVITKINPEDKYGWKSFVVKFDDSKYGSMAFQSDYLNKTVKTAQAYDKNIVTKVSAKRNTDSLIAQAKKHYPETGSHGWNHIQDVMEHARRLKGSELSPDELAAIAYHDSSLMTGARETHAEDSAEIAKRELRKYFRRKKLENIVNAIARHRASYEGKRNTPLEDLVAAADRNSPDATKDILRSYAYGKEHVWSDDDAIANTLEHIPAKYGRNGYAYKNVPEIYMKAHKDELEDAYSMLDNLTADKIREIVSKQASYEPPYTLGKIKTAQIVDHSKWPDNFHEYQKEHNDKLVWLARRAVIDDRKNRGKWGLATSNGKFLSSDDEVDDEEKLKSVIIRAGEAAKRARRASCHELAESILNRLRKDKINARRIFIDKDRYNGVAMGHSTVFFQGDDGHWHRAANGIGARKKSRLGDFDSLEDAIDQYIAVEKANKQTTDDERVDAYDTTDLPFTDKLPWPDYKALARTGKRIYHQEKKAGVRDFSGLLKLTSFIKKADPKDLTPDQSHPERNSGINDSNPAIRWAHQNYGFVPQAPGSYLGGANSAEDYYSTAAKALTHLDEEIPWPNVEYPSVLGYVKYPDESSKQPALAHINNFRPAAGKELLAYNYLRHAGAVKNSRHINDGNLDPLIFLGSYPFNTEKILAHEYGHHKADLRIPKSKPWLTKYKDIVDHWNMQYLLDPLPREVAAWDESGIPDGDSVRSAALDTYKDTPGALERFAQEAGKSYVRPDNLIASIKKQHPNLHVIMDASTNDLPHAQSEVQRELYDMILSDPGLIAKLELERLDPMFVYESYLKSIEPPAIHSLVPWRTKKEQEYINAARTMYPSYENYRYPAFIPGDTHDEFIDKLSDTLSTQKSGPMPSGVWMGR